MITYQEEDVASDEAVPETEEEPAEDERDEGEERVEE